MPHEGGEDERQGSTHSDEDRLITGGEGGSVFARLKRGFPTFSLRSWRRSPAEQTEGNQDLEAGTSPAVIDSNSQTVPAEVGVASLSEVDADSPRRALERRASSSAESSSGRQGILGGLLSLGSSALPRSLNSSTNLTPTCLICLETLTTEDFENGEAIALDCQCRGDMAMRHRTCAEKWAHVKGNRICDICKTVVKNLPDVPPRPAEVSTPGGGNAFDEADAARQQIFAAEQVPGGADVVFDCIRVTWVVMIICILFFEMTLASALWTGLIVGLAYTLFVRAMYRHQLAVMLREQQRSAGDSPTHPPHIVHVV